MNTCPRIRKSPIQWPIDNESLYVQVYLFVAAPSSWLLARVNGGAFDGPVPFVAPIAHTAVDIQRIERLP